MSLISRAIASTANRVAARPAPLRACRIWLVAATMLFAAGCTDTPDDPEGRGNIRAVHAIGGLGDVSFQIEARGLQTPGFQVTTPFSTFDSLVYDFHFDYAGVASGEIERLATATISIRPDTNHTLVLAGTPQAPRVIALEQPVPTFDPESTALEIWFGNIAPSAGSVDLYVGAPGFDPAAATPRAAAVAVQGFSSITVIESGEYEIVATVAGQPGSELFRSETATLPPVDRVLINLFDSEGETTGDHVVVLSGEITGARLIDQSAPAQVQLVHTSLNAGNIDLYINEPLTTPVFADAPFGFVSVPTTIAEADDLAEFTVTTTVAGNVGAVLTSSPSVLSDGSLSLLFFSGDQAADTLVVQTLTESRRSIFDAASVGFYNAIQNTPVVDIYLADAGSNFLDSRPIVNDATPSLSTSLAPLRPQAYDLYVVENQTNDVLLGPVAVDLSAGDVRRFVLVDTVDPNIADYFDVDLTQ